MARFIKHIVLFLFFALPVYCALLFASGFFVPNHYQGNFFPQPDTRSFLRERIHEIPGYAGTDLLVVGPSLVQRGFDPRVFKSYGYRIFLLASGGQNPMQSHILLKRYLDTLKPKRIVFVVYPDLFVKDGVEPSLDLAISDRIDGQNWEDLVRRPNLRLFNTLLYWHERQVFGLRAPALRDSNEYDRYIPGGFLERRDNGRNNELPQACDPGPQLPLNREHLRFLDECLSLTKKKSIPYQIVQLPLTTARYKCRTASAGIDSLLSMRGPYFNFNGRVLLNDTFDFSDNAHLMPSGAIRFSEAFIWQMRQTGFLK
ncbi:MAG: hypothetical protein EOP50_02720 [Sphingobacteriales bacterium]|nr:MAG: hypothetical protein EOP50_02720 [Sphingobacteriales bacterium]